MAKQDYYHLLGVPRDADIEVIKKAYRQRAMQYHPDRNPGDKASEHRFKEISEAYDVLKDDQKRAAYDRYGHAAFDGAAQGARAGGFGFGGDFSDIFDQMFGEFVGGGRAGANRRGGDLRYNLNLSLEESFAGKKATVRVTTSVACESCHGTGGEKGAQPVTCSTCRGHGKVRAQQGFFTIERTCPACHGAGRAIENPCRACEGMGRVRKERTLKVDIPAGVEDGTRMRLAGEGEAGLRGAPPGDLYIFLSIAAHRIFQRDGANVLCRVPIPMATAALGGALEVPTVDGGRARVTIPAGTQTGAQFRLRGKGMTVLRAGHRGDMFIEAFVETPVNLSKRQQEMLRELDGAGAKGTSPQAEGFLGKVKEFWGGLTESK